MKELEKICIPLGKIEYYTHCKFCTYHRIFNLRKISANILAPYIIPNDNNANINSNR